MAHSTPANSRRRRQFEKDRSTVLAITDNMLTKQKIQEFFQQNIPTQ
ncbi:MAG: hypothetical protein ABW007_27915 [Chitinophagaceae bacterium]